MGKVYEQSTRPNRHYIDQDGNFVKPKWEGGGIINRGLVEPPSFEETTKKKKIEIKEKQNVPLDEETKKALEVLKKKGLL